MKPRIWLSLAHMSGREQEFIQEAFDTNWVVPLGPNVNAFEKSLRDFLIENGELKIENGKSVFFQIQFSILFCLQKLKIDF